MASNHSHAFKKQFFLRSACCLDQTSKKRLVCGKEGLHLFTRESPHMLSVTVIALLSLPFSSYLQSFPQLPYYWGYHWHCNESHMKLGTSNAKTGRMRLFTHSCIFHFLLIVFWSPFSLPWLETPVLPPSHLTLSLHCFAGHFPALRLAHRGTDGPAQLAQRAGQKSIALVC